MANLINIFDKSTGITATTENKPILPRLYNQIVLTLENSIIPELKLNNTPSRLDGLDAETEKDLRIVGCELIQTAGILLKLPQVAMATAQIIFQRFFYSQSFVRHKVEMVAMSCVNLAAKIEETPRKIRDVANVFHHIKQIRGQKDITPMISDEYYNKLKAQIIKAEHQVLKALGFNVHVTNAYKLLVMYIQVLSLENYKHLIQLSWNFMSDSLRTDVFMRYDPKTIACACIYLSARKLSISLPIEPRPWYGLFQVTEDHIIDICYRVMELYTRAKPNVKKLEITVNELNKSYMEAKKNANAHTSLPALITTDHSGFIQRTITQPLSNETSSSDNTSSTKTARTRSRSRSNSIDRYRKSRCHYEREHHRENLKSHSSSSSGNRYRSKYNSRSSSNSSHSKNRKKMLSSEQHTDSVSHNRSDRIERDRKYFRPRSPNSYENKKRSRNYSRSPSSLPQSKHHKRAPSPNHYTENSSHTRRDKHQVKNQMTRSESFNIYKRDRDYTPPLCGSKRENCRDSRHRKG